MIFIIIICCIIAFAILLGFFLVPIWTYEDRELLIKINFKRFQLLYQANPEYWRLDTDGIPVYDNYKGSRYCFKFNILDYWKYQIYSRRIKRIKNNKETTEYALRAFKQINKDLKAKQTKDEEEIKKQLEKCYPLAEYELVFLNDINRAVVVNKTTIKDIEN